jgi:BirA family transcriptional regulator, biotin operon repressor / biotin---[acetyl-CoA-carboxylase] ligase
MTRAIDPGGKTAAPANPPISREVPGRSEALTPAAVQRILRSPVFGHRILYYPTLSSTNDRAAELAAAGEPEGTVVIAEEQTAGRGRRQRSWSSGAGLGIYASLILRPRIEAPRAPLFTLMAAVAVTEALRETCALDARIKWPNDVLVGPGKIAGILGEVRGAEPLIRELVVGMGVNVGHRHEDFPPELRQRATSVRIEAGRESGRAPILAALLEGFERRYSRLLAHGSADLLREWGTLSSIAPGRRVLAQGPDGRAEGRLLGVDDEGALLLERGERDVMRVPFGEVVEAV